MVSSRRSPDIIGSGFVILGVGYQWLYNGVNFLAFKVGGEAFHPLMLAALRFDIAAILILPLSAGRQALWLRDLDLGVAGARSGAILVVRRGSNANK